ncbi:tRNA 2'-phosphotransferase [Monosporozyma servazzii]
MEKRDIQISKSLSYLLRHGALKEKLTMDSNGYIPLQQLLMHNRLKTYKCTHEDVMRIVATNDKKRFDIKLIDGVECIAATQGHSIKNIQPDENVLTLIPKDTVLTHPLIHGTNMKGLEMILQSGFISKMQRNHIHLSPGVVGEDTNVISGMRKNSPVLIYLNTKTLVETGVLFKSLNEVFLTPKNISLSSFDHVVLRSKPESLPETIKTQLKNNKIEYQFKNI